MGAERTAFLISPEICVCVPQSIVCSWPGLNTLCSLTNAYCRQMPLFLAVLELDEFSEHFVA